MESAHETIQQKNKNIVDSIRYAQHIQNAVLPDLQILEKHFSGHFLLYKPKDIVSGDFYWFSKFRDDLVVMVVADCTGHGVPGAFMSMIGTTLLHEIVELQNIYSPAMILERINTRVCQTLQKHDKDNSDGMDMVVCTVKTDPDGNPLVTFGGAKRPLYVYAENELKQYKPTKKHIGGFQKDKNRKFEETTISLKKGDKLYLTTDGFADQNSPTISKYGSHNLKNFIENTAQISIEEQGLSITNEFETFIDGMPQRDDVTVLGVSL